MSVKVLALGDVNRIRTRYEAPGIEIIEEFPPADNAYDMVIMDHVLQLATREQVPPLIKRFNKALKVGGDMIIIVPSLEWAATQIATMDDPPAAAYVSIFGTDREQNLSGMTLHWLRFLAEKNGLHVKHAMGEWYVARIGGNEVKMMQNMVIGTKLSEPEEESADEESA